MNPNFLPSSDPWLEHRQGETESYWASYSDLMAGVLMVFALITAMTLLSIGKRFVEPTERVKQWQKLVQSLCQDEEFRSMENVSVDCDTGALIISSDSLHFGFNNANLGEQGQQLLRNVVPKYLDILRKRKDLETFIDIIEVGGHTDRVDRGNANPWISINRANAVKYFLFILLHAKFLDNSACCIHQDYLRSGRSIPDFLTDTTATFVTTPTHALERRSA